MRIALLANQYESRADAYQFLCSKNSRCENRILLQRVPKAAKVAVATHMSPVSKFTTASYRLLHRNIATLACDHPLRGTLRRANSIFQAREEIRPLDHRHNCVCPRSF